MLTHQWISLSTIPINTCNSIFLKLRTEAYTSTLGLLTFWLTDWLTHSTVRIMLLTLGKGFLQWDERNPGGHSDRQQSEATSQIEVLFVILKCNSNLSFLLNPYFHTPSIGTFRIQLFKEKFRTRKYCPIRSCFPGFLACFLIAESVPPAWRAAWQGDQNIGLQAWICN